MGFGLNNFQMNNDFDLLSKKQTVYVGRVCPAAGCKTNFQIYCIEVTVATTHPTRNLVEFQHTPAGHTRPTYTVCFLLYKLLESLINIFIFSILRRTVWKD
jgi:hypothetical protein